MSFVCMCEANGMGVDPFWSDIGWRFSHFGLKLSVIFNLTAYGDAPYIYDTFRFIGFA